MKPIGIFGGTFDPIHYGHLRAALESYHVLDLAQVRFMPCHRPAHRGMPQASAVQRLTMIKKAIAGIPGMVVDDRELQSDATSYTVHSLQAIRQEVGPQTPLCLLLGRGVFSGLASWHQPEKLIALAHIVIVDRPEDTLVHNDFTQALMQHETRDLAQLHQQPAGHVYVQSNTPLGISASHIRKMLAYQLSPQFLLPDSVLEYIIEQQLYQSKEPSAV